jgi:hypothetical protein
LKIGKPKKYIWPKIDLNDNAERWFSTLLEDDIIEHFKGGYRKYRRQDETFSFIFLPSLQKKIFLKYFDLIESITQRDVFDAYMTSYFGARLFKGRRGRGAGGKNIVFGIFQQNGKVYTEIVPDCRRKTL